MKKRKTKTKTKRASNTDLNKLAQSYERALDHLARLVVEGEAAGIFRARSSDRHGRVLDELIRWRREQVK
jgi:hypothetical protein